MKLIIEIPDHEYRQIKEVYEKNDTVESTYSYIYHGIPLDDVKAKIQAEEMVETDIAREFYNMALADAIQILDNIGKAESEDT